MTKAKEGHQDGPCSGTTSVFVRRGSCGHEQAQREGDTNRHRENMALCKPGQSLEQILPSHPPGGTCGPLDLGLPLPGIASPCGLHSFFLGVGMEQGFKSSGTCARGGFRPGSVLCACAEATEGRTYRTPGGCVTRLV